MLPYVPLPYSPPHLHFCWAATGGLRGLGGHGGCRDGWEEQTHVISVCCTQIITFKITKFYF